MSCAAYSHGGVCAACGEEGCLDRECDSTSYRKLRADGVWACQSCLVYGDCLSCTDEGCHADSCKSTSYFNSADNTCVSCTEFGNGEYGTGVCTLCSQSGGCAYGTLDACDAESYVTNGDPPHMCRSCEDFGNGLDGAGRCIICNAVQGCIEETGCFRGSYWKADLNGLGKCLSCSDFDGADGVGSCQHCSADGCLACGDYSYLTADGLCHSCGQFDAEDFVNGNEIGRCLSCNDNGGTLRCSHCENGYFYDKMCFDCGEGFSFHEDFRTCQPCNRFNSDDTVARCSRCESTHCKPDGCVVDADVQTHLSYGYNPDNFGKCTACGTQYCTRCPGGVCRSCETDYLLSALNVCLYKCSQITSHAECNSHASCVSHYEGYACRACRDEFDRADDHGECVECTTRGCTKRVCFHGYFHAGDGICKECKGVDENCAICDGQGEEETPVCLKCIGGYRYMPATKKCKLENPGSFRSCPFEEDMNGHNVQYSSADWLTENWIRRGHACIMPGESLLDLKAQGIHVCGCPYRNKCGKQMAKTFINGQPLHYMKYYCQANNFNPYESYVEIVYNYKNTL